MAGFRGLLCGIIPARAGFTISVRRFSLCGTDHPRTRGVYIREASKLSLQDGSSPHARGLLTFTAKLKPGYRIIPARAGFTLHKG
mgnify:CR=1 FL=1